MTDDYEDEPIRINFTGVQGQRSFHLLPSGRYIATPTDFTEDFASDTAANPGARMINWEFTIESTITGETEVMVNVKDPDTHVTSQEEIKVEGRRLFDNMVIVAGSYWRMKAFLDALWYNTDGEIELWPAEIVEEGTRLVIEVGVQRAKKDRKAQKEYKARNKIVAFHPLDEEKPSDVPSAVVAEAPAEEEKTSKGKAKKEPEEAPV